VEGPHTVCSHQHDGFHCVPVIELGQSAMKKKQFESVCKGIVPELPGFVCKGWLLYRHPTNHLLRGFCCNASGFDPTKFTVVVFVLPLYVPTNHVYFLFGGRLKDDRGCDQWWDVSEPNLSEDLLSRIKSQGLPFLCQMDSPTKLADQAHGLPATQECYKLEVVAYSLAMAGDYAGAQQCLEAVPKAR
jgi:hypothetical protein